MRFHVSTAAHLTWCWLFVSMIVVSMSRCAGYVVDKFALDMSPQSMSKNATTYCSSLTTGLAAWPDVAALSLNASVPLAGELFTTALLNGINGKSLFLGVGYSSQNRPTVLSPCVTGKADVIAAVLQGSAPVLRINPLSTVSNASSVVSWDICMVSCVGRLQGSAVVLFLQDSCYCMYVDDFNPKDTNKATWSTSDFTVSAASSWCGTTASVYAIDMYCAPVRILTSSGVAICNSGCQPRGSLSCCLPETFNATRNGTGTTSALPNGDDNVWLEAAVAGLSCAIALDITVFCFLRHRAARAAEDRRRRLAPSSPNRGHHQGLAKLANGRLSVFEIEALTSALMDQHFSLDNLDEHQSGEELRFVFSEVARHYVPPPMATEDGNDDIVAFLAAGASPSPLSYYGDPDVNARDEVGLGRCPVCLEEASASMIPLHVVAFEHCHHRAHRTCLRGYIRHCVQQGAMPAVDSGEGVKCPVFQCACILF